ncbi:UPF0271 protein [Alteribacillus persepolensis]|uniref:5-oxoprolinase subunit A n=1 Tax=Alteribacillus persepolensis TaxID=568899 RepID=A0A1G8J6D9_9BACI|nr:5-oxoprolinase subunit PxpA [Alteribacillus persepolensis]SDI26603.1 UPF0271 protein [Alteribacillus persepolensis]
MTRKIDVNSDLGESFGVYKIGEDDKMLKLITSANIACGYHAGDHNVMAQTIRLAKQEGTAVGAHPGFPDIAGFGRRKMEMDPEEVYHLVIYQVGALYGFCRAQDIQMQHVKPHGALFNMASSDEKLAEAIAKAIYDVDKHLILYGLSGSKLIQAGEQQGLKTANEVFADRTYQPDGTLTPRHYPHAVIENPEEASEHVLQMVANQEITAVDGSVMKTKVDTICVHGDNAKSLSFVKQLLSILKENNITIQSAGESL